VRHQAKLMTHAFAFKDKLKNNFQTRITTQRFAPSFASLRLQREKQFSQRRKVKTEGAKEDERLKELEAIS
jgi:hypothetical protein